ncbi:MAG: hypothetical protein FJ137_08630 [Deltaproteobacteria bacterium]|nr:hypothetical protein [Deltaproteobacteria bacterium]
MSCPSSVSVVCSRLVVPAALIVAGLAALPACSSIDSDDIDTDAITADLTARPRADGSATELAATLAAGALTFIDLQAGDRLVASSGDVQVELSANEVLGVMSYGATLDGVGEVGATVTVAFEREAFASAPSSTVELPAPVSITAPDAGAAFSRAEDDLVIALAGSASDDAVRVSWSGDCVVADGIDVPAGQASVTIARGTLAKAERSSSDADAAPIADSCSLRIVAERTIEGVLDPAYEGGRITAVTSDSREVTTSP